MLLLHVPGSIAVSWESLRRSPPGGGEPTFQGYARELGLLQDDAETVKMLSKGVRTMQSIVNICGLCAEALVWLEVNDTVSLWNKFMQLLSQHHAFSSETDVYRAVDEILVRYNTSLENLHIHAPDPAAVLTASDRAEREYTAELRSPYEQQLERKLFDALPLNKDQKLAFDAVFESIEASATGSDTVPMLYMWTDLLERVRHICTERLYIRCGWEGKLL